MNRMSVVITALALLLPGLAVAATKVSAWNSSAGPNAGSSNPHFRLSLPVASSVQIDLRSTAADTYLYLLNAAGAVPIAGDDNSGGGTNSRLVVSLPAGNYMIVAGTASANQAGDFTLSVNQGTLNYCFIAFTDSKYRGSLQTFCDGSALPDNTLLASSVPNNDAYSSLRVPKGMRVRAYEHANGGGRGRTYFSDVPYVGDGFNDIISSFTWGDFQTDNFFMAVASDSQFSWSNCDDDTNSERCAYERRLFGAWSNDDISRYYNRNMVNAINKVKDYLGEKQFGGTIVNGDLTEFGNQSGHLDDYINIYEHGLQSNMYLGLGNHDYENNVDDCWQNTCASDMVTYLSAQVKTLNPNSFDYYEGDTYWDWGQASNRRDHWGSLGYSWDIGKIHFVQQNNYLSYNRSWDGWNFANALRDYFQIGTSFAWSIGDLQLAKNRGQEIVLNTHEFNADAAFTYLLDTYPVAAVYAGHEHAKFGLQYAWTLANNPDYANHSLWSKNPASNVLKEREYLYDNNTIAVPVNLSGASHWGTFLVTRYVNGKVYTWLMQVDHFDNAKLYVIDRNYIHHDASNLAGIFDVCAAPCAAYYQPLPSTR